MYMMRCTPGAAYRCQKGNSCQTDTLPHKPLVALLGFLLSANGGVFFNWKMGKELFGFNCSHARVVYLPVKKNSLLYNAKY